MEPAVRPASPPGFAPETAEFYLGDPDAAFATLRRDDPVHWYEDGRFWCITKHADVQDVGRRPRDFCSSRGTQIFQIALRHEGSGLPSGDDSLNALGEVAPNIIMTDPPQHNRMRKLVIGAFTPRASGHLEPRIREIARESLAAVPRGEVVNFVDDLAVPLPMLVIAEMLGVPREDHADFRRWSDQMIRTGAGIFDDESTRALPELLAYLAERVKERRDVPRDDVLSMLLRAEIDGDKLSDPEIVMFLMTLLVAGNETTRNLLAGGMRLLFENPDQRARLVAEPERLPNAIEEMLRMVSPVRNFCRSATRDVELRGKTIRAGDWVAMFYASANRDEEVFGDDSHAFRIDRPNAKQHVAFGFGEHLCLGASLARLEARVMFEELLPLLAGIEPAGDVEPLPSSLMNGLVRMPVVLPA
jgi:cytochrome P450